MTGPTSELLSAAYLARRGYSVEALLGTLGDDARARVERVAQETYDFPARALDPRELSDALRTAAGLAGHAPSQPLS